MPFLKPESVSTVALYKSRILTENEIKNTYYKNYPEHPTIAQHTEVSTTLLMAMQAKLHRAELV